MISELGTVCLLLTFGAAMYAIIASVIGVRRASDRLIVSGRNAGLLTFPLLLLASLLLLDGLLTQQYQISYVWQVSDPNTPTIFRFTALWGSQQGSLLIWCLLMSAFAVGALATQWREYRRLMPYVNGFSMATLAFFVGLVLFLENPFTRIWVDAAGNVVGGVLQPSGASFPPADRLAETARGLNPLLRHIGMIIHPPMLYLGFVGFTIPFAFAMAALASGDLSSNWIKATRRWTLAAWLFLSLGLILGGRWAYDVLGWGGYWGWDPVENAAFLPWLIGTAFLHSVLIQEKRGMLKTWNMSLVILTFSAVMFGTFATRSGLIESVHSFAQSEIGLPMFAFWAAVTVIGVVMIVWRRNQGRLRDEHAFAGIMSRESLFVLNNVIFVALTGAIFWGSFGAPIIAELTTGTDITLGAEYFEMVTPPLFIAMYLLMGIAPLTAWGATRIGRLGRSFVVPFVITIAALAVIFLTGVTQAGALLGYGVVLLAGIVALYETARGAAARKRSHHESWFAATLAIFGRNRRRYGGFIVHLGITVIGIGVIGSTLFQQETQQTLNAGESLALGGYTLTFDSMDTGQIAEDGRIMDIANLSLSRDGGVLAMIRPRLDFYPNTDGMNTMTIAGAHSTLENDFYVLLSGFEQPVPNDPTSTTATFKVYLNPLVNLVWWGGIILIIGTVISTSPNEPSPVRARRPDTVHVAATT
jgi:cytochrome c-type biogenesis protein CcmF